MAESKVQKVARRSAPIIKKRIGPCGHEVYRVKFAPHMGRPRFRWYCETCWTFEDKGESHA